MVFQIMINNYDVLINDYSDPRVKDWFLMSSPFPTVYICLTYIFLVKIVGPKFMKNRRPFILRKGLLVYNFIHLAFSIWLFYEALDAAWLTKYSFRCEPVDYSYTPEALRIARGCWCFYLSKFLDLFDTIFFILRKKHRKITTAHVIHHSIMPLCMWIGIKYAPGGHGTFLGLMGAIFHIYVYAYYFLVTFSPQLLRKLSWWKKNLKTLQLIQMILVFIHSSQLLFIECDYPKVYGYSIALSSMCFYYLFSN